jgi:hypothetical protein
MSKLELKNEPLSNGELEVKFINFPVQKLLIYICLNAMIFIIF